MKKNELASRKVWVYPCTKEKMFYRGGVGNLYTEAYDLKKDIRIEGECECSPRCTPIRATLKLVV